MHLPTIRESFEQLAHRAIQEMLSYEQHLPKLSQGECQVYKANRTERLLRQSSLRLEKDLPNSKLDRFRPALRTVRQACYASDLMLPKGPYGT